LSVLSVDENYQRRAKNTRMAVIDVNWNPSPKELRVFSALLIVFCAIIGGVSYYNSSTLTAVGYAAIGGAVVGAIGCVGPNLIRVVYVVWMAAVLPVGLVVSNVVIGLVFFGVVWPIGVVMRWKHVDSLRLDFDKSAKSYWIKRSAPKDQRQYFRQY
jgi:hypothetical protein